MNMSVELASRGRRLVYLDGDLGLANGHLLLGIEPLSDLRELVGRGKTVHYCLEEGPHGLGVMAGASGLAKLADLRPAELRRFTERMADYLDGTEFLFMDSAAGISWQTLLLLHAANYVVLVTTPQLPALTDAYAVAKALFTRDPGRPLGVVVNRVRDRDEGERAFERLSEVTFRFLGERPRLLGVLHEGQEVQQSVNECIPFVVSRPEGRASEDVKGIADTLLAELSTDRSETIDPFAAEPEAFPDRLRGLLSGRKRRW